MKKLASLLLTLIAVIISISCEIGLGASVDTEPPSIEIDAGIVDKTIAGDFEIEGSWSDDGSIEKISAVLMRTDGNGIEIEVSGSIEESAEKRGSGRWKIPVKAESEGITDGSYQATIKITDSVGRVTTQNTTFTIDNTAPVLILTKPNSRPGDETVSAYGQRIFLEGSIADTAKETNITVEFYADETCSGAVLTTISKSNIAPTDVNSNNARIAVYADKEDLEKQYDRIYNPEKPDGKEGSKEVYIKITASDIAGNSTTDFYFSKDLAKDLTKSSGTDAYSLAPIDIYNILNHTDELKKTARAAEDTKRITELLKGHKADIAKISINPENSPYFTVSGMKALTKSGKDFESQDNGYFVINGAQTLEISVFMGSDSIEIADDSADTPAEERSFYVYALECDENCEAVKEDKEENRIKLYSKSKETGIGINKKTYYSIGGKQTHKTTAGAYVFTVPMTRSLRINPDDNTFVTQNLEYGKNYLILVSGKDNEDNPVEPGEATGYGFHFTTSGGAPVLNISEPKDNTVFHKKGDGIVFEGSAKSEEGIPEITVWNGSTKIADIPLNTETDGELNEFSSTIPSSVFSQDESKIYSISIKASRGESLTESKYSVWYDVEGPVIDIMDNAIQPVITANGKDSNINGKLSLNGTIIDKFDQFKRATFRVFQNGTEVEGVRNNNLESSFNFVVDTTKLTDKCPAKFVIEAYDRVENIPTAEDKSKWEKEFYVDQSTDKPVFTNTSSSLDITQGTSESLIEEGKNMFMRGSSLVLGVSDDDSVKEAEVILEKKKDDGSFEEADRNDETKTLYNKYENPSVITHTIPNAVGIYRATVKAYDVNYVSEEETPNNMNEVTFMIRVTGTGPDVSITTPDKDYISTLGGNGSIRLHFDVKGVGDRFKLYRNEQALFSGEDAGGKESPFDYILTYTQEELSQIESGEKTADDITFKVTDNQGFTDKVYTPKFDSDLPEVSITKCPPVEADGSTEESSYLFKGAMSDGTSGIKGVSIKFINGENAEDIQTQAASSEGWIECTSGSAAWSYEAVWAEIAAFATEGKKTVIVKAEDGSGNIKTAFQSFTYDRMKPQVLSITGQETTRGDDVILSINLMDTNLTVPQVYVKQGTSVLEVELSATQPAANSESYTSTVTIPFAASITADGIYDIEVIAKDANGRSSSAPHKTHRIIRDHVAPEITFTSPAVSSDTYIQKSSYKFEGSITDTNEIKETEAKLYKLNEENGNFVSVKTEKLSPNKDDNGKWTWQVYELEPGTYKTEVTAEDIAGNKNTLTCSSVNMDNKRPDLVISSANLTDAAGNPVGTLSSGTTYYASQSGYTVTVTVTDTNFDYSYIKADGTGLAVISEASGQELVKTSASAKAFTFNPKNYEDGIFTYTVKVEDKAGNKADDVIIKVQRDTTGPNVEIRNPAADITDAKNALNGSSYSFRINANDGSGVGVAKLYYAFSKKDNVLQIAENEWVEIDFTDGDKNIDIPLISGTEAVTDIHGRPTSLCEGDWYLYAKAKDKSGNVTEFSTVTVSKWKRFFPVDQENPVLSVDNLSESGVNPLYTEIQDGGYTISGTASDSNKLDEIAAVTIDVDGTRTAIAKEAITDSKWSYKIITGTEDGKLKADEPVVVKVTAKDATGKENTKTFTLYYDTKKPELSVTAPVTDEAVGENKKEIKGTVSDGGYGIKELKYELYNADTNTLIKEGTTAGVNPDVKIKGEQWYIQVNEGKIPLGTKEGSLRLEVTAIENTNAAGTSGGRQNVVPVSFSYDIANPEITENGIGTAGKTTNGGTEQKITLSGTAWDSNKLDRIEISCGGKTWTSKNPAPEGKIYGISLTPGQEETDPYNWTADFSVGSAAGTNHIDDGTNEFVITAYDTAKKEKQIIRTVIVDTQKPTVGSVTVNPEGGITIGEGDNAEIWYKTTSVPVTVEVSDKENDADFSSEISKVEYQAGNGNLVPLSYDSSTDKYYGTVNFSGNGIQTLKLKATDVAGNISDEKTTVVHIDTTAPVLSALYYKKGSEGNATAIENNIYVKTNTQLTVYGNYEDAESGVNALVFTYGSPEVTYSETAIGNNAPSDTAYTISSSQISGKETSIKSWKAVFTPSDSGKFTVNGSNRTNNPAGEIKVFDVTVDREAPDVDNLKLIEGSGTEQFTAAKEAYSDDTTYYVNNTGKTFKISGVATDTVGVDSVELLITENGTGNTKTAERKGSLGQWYFEGIDLSSWTGSGATVKLTVKDKAGNEAAASQTTINISFDVTAPQAKHKIDDLSKDLEFRIGDYANEAGNTDVGGKYFKGTYGSALTMQIRGNFKDNEGGSGINKYYYKTFNNQEVFINPDKENGATETGKIFFKTLDDLKTYVISNKTDTFQALSADETKAVEYNIKKETDGYNYSQNNEKVKAWGGNATGESKTENGIEYVQFRTDITSNYKTTIKGFDEGKNYLVLVAEDNAGNTSVDYAEVPIPTQQNPAQKTLYPCYSLNVDIKAPTIPQKHEGIVYTNVIKKLESGEQHPEETVIIKGTVSDKPNKENGSSGIDEIVFTSDQNNAQVKLKASDLTAATDEEREEAEDLTLMKWEVDVRPLLSKAGTAIISAKVTDNAKFSTSEPVANITVDQTSPTLAITTPVKPSADSDAKVGASFTLSGTAGDGNGAGLDTSKTFILYYTTNDEAGSSVPENVPSDDADASETWKKLADNITAGENWSYSANLTSIAADGANTDIYFTISATDKAGYGNTGYSSPRKFTVDRAKPELASLTVGGKNNTQITGAWFKDTTLKISGTFTDTNGSGVKSILYKVGSENQKEVPSTGTFNTNAEGFVSGNNTFLLWAVDEVGNESEKIPYTLKVDTVAPTIEPETEENFSKVQLINGKADKTFKFYVTEKDSGLKSENPVTVKIGDSAVSLAANDVSFGDADENGKRLVTVNINKDNFTEINGYQTVTATVSDLAGWVTSQQIGLLNKDRDPPSVEFTSPEPNAQINKTITISGKAKDANEITKVTLTAVCDATSKSKTYVYEKGKSNNSITYANTIWEAVIDTYTDLDNTFNTEGNEVTFSLTAEDEVGNVTETAKTIKFTINQNSDRPVITIGSGVDFTKKNDNEIWVKGSSTIYGSVTDDDGIANGGFKIYRKAKDDITFTDASASYSGGSWNVKLPKDDSYILKFEVKDKGKFADSATGELKETGTSFVSADINASGTDAQLLATPIIEDSPEATEQNQNPTPNKLGNTKANGNTLIPVCLDTQAPTLKIEAVSYDKSAWVEDINKSDFYLGGKKNTFYVKVTASDTSGLYGTGTEAISASFSGTVKADDVEYRLICPENSCTVEAGSATGEFIIKVENFNKAGKVIKTTNDEGQEVESISEEESDKIDFSGTLLLTISAKDKAELTTDKQLSRTIDNAKPVIKITAPVAVTSTATVTGNIEGETVNPSVYYMVTPDDTQPDSESEYWKHESFASLAYSIYFDGTSSTTGTHTDLFRTYLTKAPVNAATSEQIANNVYKDLTDVYVWIKAVDVCGNESYEKAKVVVDPQGNRPTVNVTYPDIDGIKLGGTIRLMGTASDNVEVKYVWIKLDTDNDGEWKLADYNKLKAATNSAYTFGQISTNKKLGTGEGEVNITPSVSNISDIAIMVKVSGGSSWNLTVNADGELIPDGAADNTVTMWASATDDDKKDGSSIQESTPVVRSFTVDKNNPYFIQDTLRLTREADSQTYKEGMSVRGVWYLEGTVVDDSSGIKKITVKLEGSDADTIYINKEAANPVVEVTTGDYQFRKNTTIRAGKTNYDFKIKVGEATGVGKKSFRITAYEDTENNLSAYKDFLVRYDNEKPVLATQDSEAFKISSSVKNDQGYYSLESRAYERNDGDTGVNRIAVYFTRKKGDKTYIFDPMYKRGYTPEGGSDVSMMETGTTLAQDSGTDGDMLYWGTASATSISSKTLTLSSPAASYVHAGGLAKVKGVIYRIESVSDKTVELDEEPGNTTEATDVKFAVANVVDNTDPESKHENPSMITDHPYGYGYCSNFVYDDGDKIMEKLHKDDSTSWTWNLWVNSKNIPDGDVDIHYVVFDKAGNSRHDVIENASVINNRPRLVSVALGIDVNQDGDTADTGETVNYYPDGKEGLADKPVKYSNAKETINISGITVKGKMTVTPEIVGGNGDLFYQWKTKDKTNWHKVETNTNSPDEPAPLMSGNDNYDDVDFNNANDYIASGASSLTTQTGTITHNIPWLIENSTDNDSDFNISYEIFDSTDGKTVFTDTNKVSINITGINLQVRDKEAPTVTIDPFYWNSPSDNSVYTSKASPSSVKDLEGHIELGCELPEAFTVGNTDAEYDRDDKVSGIIKLKGKVEDNIILTDLYLSIDSLLEETKVASYDRKDGWKNGTGSAAFTKFGTLADNGYEFDLGTNTFNPDNGHSVEWTLLWDTSKITGVAGTDIKVQLKAYDNAKEAGHEENNTPANFSATGTRQVDVVPYVTSLTTSLSAANANNPSVYDRTALGHYPVYKYHGVDTNGNNNGYVYETVTIKGFNLYDTATVTVGQTTTVKGGKIVFENKEPNDKKEKALVNGTTVEQNFTGEAALSPVDSKVNTYTFILPNGAKSGNAHVAVGTGDSAVVSLNNSNNNMAHGADSTGSETELAAGVTGNNSEYLNYYNRLPNGVNNNRLTDDLVIDVWDFNTAAATPLNNSALDIIMKLNLKTNDAGTELANGLIGFAFCNGYKNWSMPKEDNSYTKWAQSKDLIQCTGFTYSSRGISFGTCAGGESEGQRSDAYVFLTSKWGTIDKTGADSNNSLRIEATGEYNNKVSNINKERFKSTSIATKQEPDGEDTDTLPEENIYLAFYDDINGEIRFRAGTLPSGSTNKTVGLSQNSDSKYFFGNFVDRLTNNGWGVTSGDYDYTAQDCQIVADLEGTDTLGIAGEYLSIGVLSNNVVVMVWYDPKNNNLMCSYNTTPLALEDEIEKENNTTEIISRMGKSRAGWSDAQVIIPGAGKYCNLVVDSDDGVHVAAYDSSNGDLKYAYIGTTVTDEETPKIVPDYENPKICIVDSYQAVGKELTIDVAKENKENGKQIPHIGYFGSTPKKPRYAYLSNPSEFYDNSTAGAISDQYTGVWECGIVPSPSTITNHSKRRINVGVWKINGIRTNSKTGTSQAKPGANSGKCYGNGTDNAVLGYGVKHSSTQDYVETAQKR